MNEKNITAEEAKEKTAILLERINIFFPIN